MGNTGSKHKDRVGTIINNRKIIALDHIDKRYYHTYWKVQCLKCKAIYILRAESLQYGDSNYCRCMTNLKINERAFIQLSKRLYQTYKHGAKIRDLNFNLTLEQFQEFIAGTCYYCGKLPYAVYKDPTVKTRKSILYNGIDRLNNKKGYSLDNVVSCCKICNRMKMDLSWEDFLTHVVSIVQYRTHDWIK